MFRGLGWYRVKRVQASFDSCLFMPMAGGPKSLNGSDAVFPSGLFIVRFCGIWSPDWRSEGASFGLAVSAYSLHCSSFFGLTKYIIRILESNPKKELQWRL